jgi:16S rRNA (guanine1207-N2)-methyltransferase
MDIPDVYYKKTIEYPFKGQKFSFDVANTLFSTFEMDHGSDILIRSIVTKSPKTILDLGCGYGPLGIILAETNPQAEVTMLDSNLLAVRYTRLNLERNNITNATVFGSVGTEGVRDKTFDLIVSNIPAKIGDEAITQEFVLASYELLNPGGELWVVVVSALNRLIPKLGGVNKMKVKAIRKRRGHTVYQISKPK